MEHTGSVDIHYLDGHSLEGAQVLSRSPTSLLVMHHRAVITVHAAEVTEKSAKALGIRLPTEEERAVLRKAEQEQRERAREQELAAEEFEQHAIEELHAQKLRQAEIERSRPKEQPREVRVAATVEFKPRSVFFQRPSQRWIQGRIVSRLKSGAIVQADGLPQSGAARDVGWISGMIYIVESNRLNATTQDSPINGQVVSVGEHRYVDSSGTVRVLQAWRVVN